ncbi:MAG TPA: hypothetical protein VKS79_17960 [Gemmataceae bacterium]|nr:hypothetical protein [Gemmataceae bacterium]
MSPNHDSDARPALHRRDFAQAALLAGIAAAAAASRASADDPKPEEKITLAKAVEAVVRQRFGEHLTEDQIKSVVQRAQGRFSSRPKQETSLKNSDEPAFMFQADI